MYIYIRICDFPQFAVITGWRGLIGSPKLQIVFHKRATKYRSLWQKMTYKDKGSYESSPPFTLLHVLVGSLKLQVSFAEYRLFYRALLQKRPMILRSLLIVATPYPAARTKKMGERGLLFRCLTLYVRHDSFTCVT